MVLVFCMKAIFNVPYISPLVFQSIVLFMKYHLNVINSNQILFIKKIVTRQDFSYYISFTFLVFVNIGMLKIIKGQF